MGVNVRASFLVHARGRAPHAPAPLGCHRAALQPRRAAGGARHVLLLHVQGCAAEPGARGRPRSRAGRHHGELRLPERHLHPAARRPPSHHTQWRGSAPLLCRTPPAGARPHLPRHRIRHRLRRLSRSPPASPAPPYRSTPASARPGTISATRPGSTHDLLRAGLQARRRPLHRDGARRRDELRSQLPRAQRLPADPRAGPRRHRRDRARAHLDHDQLRFRAHLLRRRGDRGDGALPRGRSPRRAGARQPHLLPADPLLRPVDAGVLRRLLRQDRAKGARPRAGGAAQRADRPGPARPRSFGHRLLGGGAGILSRPGLADAARSALPADGPQVRPAPHVDLQGHHRASAARSARSTRTGRRGATR